jgi:hypothetical protein
VFLSVASKARSRGLFGRFHRRQERCCCPRVSYRAPTRLLAYIVLTAIGIARAHAVCPENVQGNCTTSDHKPGTHICIGGRWTQCMATAQQPQQGEWGDVSPK